MILSKCNVLISYLIFVLKEKLQLFILNIFILNSEAFFLKCQSFMCPHTLDVHKTLSLQERDNIETLVIVCYVRVVAFQTDLNDLY